MWATRRSPAGRPRAVARGSRPQVGPAAAGPPRYRTRRARTTTGSRALPTAPRAERARRRRRPIRWESRCGNDPPAGHGSREDPQSVTDRALRTTDEASRVGVVLEARGSARTPRPRCRSRRRRGNPARPRPCVLLPRACRRPRAPRCRRRASLDSQRGVERWRRAQGDLGDAVAIGQRRGDGAARVPAVARSGRSVVASVDDEHQDTVSRSARPSTRGTRRVPSVGFKHGFARDDHRSARPRCPDQRAARDARRGDPPLPRRGGLEDRGTPRTEPRRGRADHGDPPGLRLPERTRSCSTPDTRATCTSCSPAARTSAACARRAASRATRSAPSRRTTSSRARTHRARSRGPTASRARSR